MKQHVEDPDCAAWQGYGSKQPVSSLQLLFGQPHVQVDNLGSALGGHVENVGFVDTAVANVVKSLEGEGVKGTDMETGMVGCADEAVIGDRIGANDGPGTVDDLVCGAGSKAAVSDAETEAEKVVFGVDCEE